ncbi:MAG: DUF4367 domain-containing protein [Ruminococcus sp.]|nr:DUF4367 domain-containing protein [Ruminococcus sp.]
MGDEILKQALAEVCGNEYQAEPFCGDIPDSYRFSHRFEKRMAKALGTAGSITVSGKPNIRKRMKIALVAAVIFSAGFMLGMAREPIWNFITHKVDGGSQLSFDTSTVDDPETSINEVYTLTGLPNDYELLDSTHSKVSATELWVKQSEGADHADNIIYFGQYIAAVYTDAFIPDDAKNGYYIDSNGTQYYISESEDYTSVVWYNGDYVLLLTGSFNKDEMLDLCKTVKLKK